MVTNIFIITSSCKVGTVILHLPYGMKILHGIKFYGFTVVGRTVKLKSINFYYCVAKIR